jgi:adenylate kinase
MSSSVYVSGLPGVGKTSAVKHLVDTRPDDYVRLSFGELLRSVVAPNASVESFRSSASSVDRAVIEAATDAAAQRIRDERRRVVLMDSHAVSPVAEGLRATPDTAARVATFGYSVIVHLAAAGSEARILQNSGREGRTTMSPWEVATAEAMQLSIVTRYASLRDCPLYVVSADGGVEEVAERVDRATTAGLAWTAAREARSR